MDYRIATPYLDSAGAVYLPAYGERRAVVRLSARASLLWRNIVLTGAPGPMHASDREFVASLVLEGFLQPGSE
jgi:hypothetical protein